MKEAYTALHKSKDAPRLVLKTAKSKAPGSRAVGTTPIGAGKMVENKNKSGGRS